VEISWPDAPEEDVFVGDVIGGLFYVDSQRKVHECNGDVWATGPVCNVITKAIRLSRPVPCRGSAGLWPLPSIVREEIQEQLSTLAVTYFDTKHLDPLAEGADDREVVTEADPVKEEAEIEDLLVKSKEEL